MPSNRRDVLTTVDARVEGALAQFRRVAAAARSLSTGANVRSDRTDFLGFSPEAARAAIANIERLGQAAQRTSQINASPRQFIRGLEVLRGRLDDVATRAAEAREELRRLASARARPGNQEADTGIEAATATARRLTDEERQLEQAVLRTARARAEAAGQLRLGEGATQRQVAAQSAQAAAAERLGRIQSRVASQSALVARALRDSERAVEAVLPGLREVEQSERNRARILELQIDRLDEYRRKLRETRRSELPARAADFSDADLRRVSEIDAAAGRLDAVLQRTRQRFRDAAASAGRLGEQLAEAESAAARVADESQQAVRAQQATAQATERAAEETRQTARAQEQVTDAVERTVRALREARAQRAAALRDAVALQQRDERGRFTTPRREAARFRLGEQARVRVTPRQLPAASRADGARADLAARADRVRANAARERVQRERELEQAAAEVAAALARQLDQQSQQVQRAAQLLRLQGRSAEATRLLALQAQAAENVAASVIRTQSAQESANREAREGVIHMERLRDSAAGVPVIWQQGRQEIQRTVGAVSNLDQEFDALSNAARRYRQQLEVVRELSSARTVPRGFSENQFESLRASQERSAAALRQSVEEQGRLIASQLRLDDARRNSLRTIERETGLTLDSEAARLRERAAALLQRQAIQRISELRGRRELPQQRQTQVEPEIQAQSRLERQLRESADSYEALTREARAYRTLGLGRLARETEAQAAAHRRVAQDMARQIAATRRLSAAQRELLTTTSRQLGGGGGGGFGGATAGAAGFSSALAGLTRRFVPFLTLLYGVRSAAFAVERAFRLMTRAGRGIARIVTDAAEFGAEIFSMSRNLRFAIPDLLAARQAFEGIGLSVEDASDSLAEIQEQIGRALTGTRRTQRQARHLFAQLGLDQDSLAQLAPQQAFNEVISRLAQLDSAFERYQVGAQLLGEANAEIVGQAGELADAIQRAEDRLRAFVVPTEEQFYAARRLREEFSGLQQNLRNTGIVIANQLAPAILAGIQRFYEWAGSSRELADRFVRLVRIFGDVAYVAGQISRAVLAVTGSIIQLNTIGARLGGARWALDLNDAIEDVQVAAGETVAAIENFRNLDSLSFDFGEVPEQLRDVSRFADGYAEALLRGREAATQLGVASLASGRDAVRSAQDQQDALLGLAGADELARREAVRASTDRVEALDLEIETLTRRIAVLREAGQFDQTFRLETDVFALEAERDALLGTRDAAAETRVELERLRSAQGTIRSRIDTAELIGDFEGANQAEIELQRVETAIARYESRLRQLSEIGVVLPDFSGDAAEQARQLRLLENAIAAEIRRRQTIVATGTAATEARAQVAGFYAELRQGSQERAFEQSIANLPEGLQEVARAEREFETRIRQSQQALVERRDELARQVGALFSVGNAADAVRLLPDLQAAEAALQAFRAELGPLRQEQRDAFDAAEVAAYEAFVEQATGSLRDFNLELQTATLRGRFRGEDQLERLFGSARDLDGLRTAYQDLRFETERLLGRQRQLAALDGVVDHDELARIRELEVALQTINNADLSGAEAQLRGLTEEGRDFRQVWESAAVSLARGIAGALLSAEERAFQWREIMLQIINDIAQAWIRAQIGQLFAQTAIGAVGGGATGLVAPAASAPATFSSGSAPLTGSASGSLGAGAPPVTVNFQIDARGGDEASIRRAIDQARPALRQDAVNGVTQGLTQAGALRTAAKIAARA